MSASRDAGLWFLLRSLSRFGTRIVELYKVNGRVVFPPFLFSGSDYVELVLLLYMWDRILQ